MRQQKLAALCAILFFVCAAFVAFAAGPKTYTFQKGDTLYSVARRFSVTYESLAAANGIKDPTKVQPGTVLTLPSVYVAAKGDTLYSIARKYGTSVAELSAMNKLSSTYVLKVGDTLVVPAPEESPAASNGVSGAASPAASGGASTSTTSTTTTTSSTVRAASTTTTVTIAAPTVTTLASTPPTTSTYAPMPEPLRTQNKVVDAKLSWPALGKAFYLDGKLDGVMIRVAPGESSRAVAAGTVVSAGPSRGFGQVAFVQSKAGYVYVYGGNETLFVKTGDPVVSGKEIGKIGPDAKDGSLIAYFFVFRNGQSIDPSLAPRD